MKRSRRTLAFLFALVLCLGMLPTFTFAAEKDAVTVKSSSRPRPSLLFYSEGPLTLRTANNAINWDGRLEYSTNGIIWNIWNGTAISAGRSDQSLYTLYLRGSKNSVICTYPTQRWVFTGSHDIECSGNIETLLDYSAVASGQHPQMAAKCFMYMFKDCKKLVSAPQLSATVLSDHCYYNMFRNCTSLRVAPALPATTLAPSCYEQMFYQCSSLTRAPALPARVLRDNCYAKMFAGCTSLKSAPALPAKTLATSCYFAMFLGCTDITTAPNVLPATTLAPYCYKGMFHGCTSLTNAPALPAKTLTYQCYSNMFDSCYSLVNAPALPATTLAEYCYYRMFGDCRTMISIPALPATVLPRSCYERMFMGCSKIKLSWDNAYSGYSVYYRIPIHENTTVTDVGDRALYYMFRETGGMLWEINANQTYYLHENNAVIW